MMFGLAPPSVTMPGHNMLYLILISRHSRTYIKVRPKNVQIHTVVGISMKHPSFSESA